jgi:hypothetical protein
MPKAYSFDLRERVIEAVEIGASRREAAETGRARYCGHWKTSAFVVGLRDDALTALGDRRL